MKNLKLFLIKIIKLILLILFFPIIFLSSRYLYRKILALKKEYKNHCIVDGNGNIIFKNEKLNIDMCGDKVSFMLNTKTGRVYLILEKDIFNKAKKFIRCQGLLPPENDLYYIDVGDDLLLLIINKNKNFMFCSDDFTLNFKMPQIIMPNKFVNDGENKIIIRKFFKKYIVKGEKIYFYVDKKSLNFKEKND